MCPRRVAGNIQLAQMRVRRGDTIATAVNVLALEAGLRVLGCFNVAHLGQDDNRALAAERFADGDLLETVAHELLTHLKRYRVLDETDLQMKHLARRIALRKRDIRHLDLFTTAPCELHHTAEQLRRVILVMFETTLGVFEPFKLHKRAALF